MRGMASFYRHELERLESEGKVKHYPEAGVKVFAEPYDGRAGYHHVKAWSGNRAEPFYDYLVKNDRVEETVAGFVTNGVASFAYKAKRKVEERKSRDANSDAYKVGTVLHGSWGYDETRCELYEIVERPSPFVAVIRELCCDSEGCSAIASYMTPKPGHYCGPLMTSTRSLRKSSMKRSKFYLLFGVLDAFGWGSLTITIPLAVRLAWSAGRKALLTTVVCLPLLTTSEA